MQLKSWCCHEADVPIRAWEGGWGPQDTRYRAAMTKEIVGGAGVRRSRTEFRRWQCHANETQKEGDSFSLSTF